MRKNVFDNSVVGDSMPLYGWQLLFLFFWWLFWLVSLRKKRSYKKRTILALGFLTFSTGGPLIRGYMRRSHTIGSISIPDAPLYIGPDSSYPVRATLAYLSDVRIIKKENVWYYTDSASGKGWLTADAVKIIA